MYDTFFSIKDSISTINDSQHGRKSMKFNEKNSMTYRGENQLYGVDFHDFIQKHQNYTMVELASEFGLHVRDVKQLKKQLGRS